MRAFVEERARFAVPPPDQGAAGFSEACQHLTAARAHPEYQASFIKRLPLVSICVATSNRSRILIERSLQSLLRQTYRRLEIIVVGDGCTDDTALRVGQIRDSRIRFENLPVRGPYPKPGLARWCVAGTNAMNRALAMASGDFITHLDDDDQAFEERIEVLVEAMISTCADLVFHPFFHQTPSGIWSRLGNGEFRLGQVTTGSILYHHYFARYGWDVMAYRTAEPGDWNRLRRVQALGMTCAWIDRPLLFHFRERNQAPFLLSPGETFLDDVVDPMEATG